ncbi:MAG: beta-N-acetylhexosaminidase [Candidatus Omnitrophica bacterium]|nr:beta-N-acetylhexosaminidase [Candidatus Omnitrophota bacterium]
MTLKEKVGQIFQIGFDGKTVTPEIKGMIENYHIGGIIYFRRNIHLLQQIANLSNELQMVAMNRRLKLPLIISTDQEGGVVTRLTEGTHFPGNMTLGAARNAELARNAGQAIAGELKAVGINMDLAPVLDVNNNPSNPVIGVRSFGEDPLLVAKLGEAFISGMQSEGIIACGKHFPGHGDTTVDSHLGLPIVKHEKERLKKVELYPFIQAIKAGVDSIMTAHICFPAIELKRGVPATLSYNVLTGLLREELEYNGLIITDCMEMNAIASTFGTIEGSVMAIEAGSDMVLISHTLDKQKAAIEEVIKAVKAGRITEERINQSVMRILKLKDKRIGLKKMPVADCNKLGKKRGEEIALQISRQGVTLVKDRNNLIPIDKSGDVKVMVLDFSAGRTSLVEDDIKHKSYFVNCLSGQGMKVEYYSFLEKGNKLPSLEGNNQVIVCTYDAVHNPQQAKMVKKLQAKGEPLIVLAIRNPYDLNLFPEISTYLTTYDYSPTNLQVASEIITGKYEARGVLPITLKALEQ